jgi:hypothetical protein
VCGCYFTLGLRIGKQRGTGSEHYWDDQNAHPLPETYLIPTTLLKVINDDADKDQDPHSEGYDNRPKYVPVPPPTTFPILVHLFPSVIMYISSKIDYVESYILLTTVNPSPQCRSRLTPA